MAELARERHMIETRTKPVRVLIFLPIPVLVTALEAHSLKRRMVTFFLAFVPWRLTAGLGLSAIRMMTALVAWVIASSVLPKIARVELLFAAAAASFGLVRGNRHLGSIAHR